MTWPNLILVNANQVLKENTVKKVCYNQRFMFNMFVLFRITHYSFTKFNSELCFINVFNNEFEPFAIAIYIWTLIHKTRQNYRDNVLKATFSIKGKNYIFTNSAFSIQNCSPYIVGQCLIESITQTPCQNILEDLWFTCSQNFLNYLTFQPFDFERTWWRLFLKRVVRTKFDIYVLFILSMVFRAAMHLIVS